MIAGYDIGRRTARPLAPERRAALIREIVRDPRYGKLSKRAQTAISALVLDPAIPGDGSGICFWPKRAEWAAAAGLKLITFRRVKDELAAGHMIRVRRWLRPDFKEGASTIVLDPALAFLAEEEQGGSNEAEQGGSPNKVAHPETTNKEAHLQANKEAHPQPAEMSHQVRIGQSLQHERTPPPSSHTPYPADLDADGRQQRHEAPAQEQPELITPEALAARPAGLDVFVLFDRPSR